MCVWVSSFLPFYANDVLGDVEGRRLLAYAVMSAGCICCWRGYAHIIFVLCSWLLVIWVCVGVQSAVRFDAWG